MTPQQYIAKGFRLSAHTEQAFIDRAEKDVRMCYIEPIIGTPTTPEPTEVTDALANLAFLLMMQRNAFATRSGAKMKSTQDSRDADMWAIQNEQTRTCHACLERLRRLNGSTADADVEDICSIYFKGTFI